MCCSSPPTRPAASPRAPSRPCAKGCQAPGSSGRDALAVPDAAAGAPAGPGAAAGRGRGQQRPARGRAAAGVEPRAAGACLGSIEHCATTVACCRPRARSSSTSSAGPGRPREASYRHERLLRALRAPRSRHRHQGRRHALLPGLRPRPRPQVPGRGDRGAGRPGPDRGDLAGRLRRVPLLLPGCRELAGRPRARARGRPRPQARQPRGDRRLLPGGRRSRLDRPRRGPAGLAARNPAEHDLREQRDLRHDRGPARAHDAHGPEDDHQPRRTRPPRRRAAAHGRARGPARRARLRRADGTLRREAACPRAQGDPQGDPDSRWRTAGSPSSRCSPSARRTGT